AISSVNRKRLLIEAFWIRIEGTPFALSKTVGFVRRSLVGIRCRYKGFHRQTALRYHHAKQGSFMPQKHFLHVPLMLTLLVGALSVSTEAKQERGVATAGLVLRSNNLKPSVVMTLDGFFYETASGRVSLPAELTRTFSSTGRWSGEQRMPDGKLVRLTVSPRSGAFDVAFNAT